VVDTGIGITQDFVPFVFDRFRQADGSMTREHGGLGLGLAIAKELTELHGGSLTVSSRGKDQGSTFVLRLPALASTSQPAAEGVRARGQQAPTLAGFRILTVDDDADAVDVIAEGLRGAGAEVQTAQSGIQAIDQWRSGAFDVLVCDLAMPQMDGLAVLARICELSPGRRAVAAIAVSAHTREADRLRALAAGYMRHLSKPLDLNELIKAIAAVPKRERPRPA
jgi:CheY-like chemotaxis protein